MLEKNCDMLKAASRFASGLRSGCEVVGNPHGVSLFWWSQCETIHLNGMFAFRTCGSETARYLHSGEALCGNLVA
jgi:hypothetical protein